MRVLWLTILLVGCSYTFDSGAPEVPLVGVEPDTESLPHLNTLSVVDEQFGLGADGESWLILHQSDLGYRMVRMTGPNPGAVETLTPGVDYDDLTITYRALYLVKRPKPDGGTANDGTTKAQPVQLTIRAIGEHPGVTFELPGPGILYPAPLDNAFVYMVTDGKQPGYIIQRRDGSYKRIVPWPEGVDPADPFGKGSYFWDNGRGNAFFDRDANGRVVGHDARRSFDLDMGVRSRYAGWINSSTLISCGLDGLRLVINSGFKAGGYLDSSVVPTERILDNDVCQQSLLYVSNNQAYYEVGTTLKKVPLDASTPPTPVFEFGDNRILIFQPSTDTVIYSTDPSDRYALGAGDAWLNGMRFVDRGTAISFVEQTKLYWLEHSAQNSGAGELTMRTLPGPNMPGGTPRPLARNVREYDLLGDGRILCDDNHAFPGTFNRIVVIDPKANTKTWVASSANNYAPIPGSDDYIVDVVSGATGHDVVRVSLPPAADADMGKVAAQPGAQPAAAQWIRPLGVPAAAHRVGTN